MKLYAYLLAALLFAPGMALSGAVAAAAENVGAGDVTAETRARALAAEEAQDWQTAFNAWKPLADDGDAEAQYRIGSFYQHGLGVTEDEAMAAAWYQEAADQGHPEALVNLALMYIAGVDVPRDVARGVEYYRIAADSGSGRGQFFISIAYEQGNHVPRDLVQAYKWFGIMELYGETKQHQVFGATGRNRVRAKMTPEQIAEAEKLISEWTPTPQTW